MPPRASEPRVADRESTWLRRFQQIVLVLLACYWLVIFLGTHLPGSAVSLRSSDKLLHLVGYAGLAFLLGWWFCGTRPSWRGYLTALGVAALYGAVDELSQTLVPGRTCDALDWVADVIGATLGLLAYRTSLGLIRGWRGTRLRGTKTAAS